MWTGVGNVCFLFLLVWAQIITAAPAELNVQITRQIVTGRWFPEALRLGRQPTEAENQALLEALLAFAARTNRDDVSSVEEYLNRFPGSAWEASLRTELGCEYFRTGRYSMALAAWEQVWRVRTNVGPSAALIAVHRAGSHLAGLYARLGRMAALHELLPQLDRLALTGGDAERVRGAKDGLWSMHNRPEVSFRCGPLALERIRSYHQPTTDMPAAIYESKSTTNGMSLTEIAKISVDAGMNYQMAFRAPGSKLIVPAVVHWRVGHYAGLVRERNGLCLAQDPTFGDDTWISLPSLDQEASGYFLVPPGPLPPGWRSVAEGEGRTVFGKGLSTSSDPDATTPYDKTVKGQESDRSAWDEANSCGMASWDAHLMLVSQEIIDTPVGYRPPFGPPVFTTVRFVQRQNERSDADHYHWSHNWQGYLYDDVLNPFGNVGVKVGGGWLAFAQDQNDTNVFHCNTRNPGLLVRASATNYVWQFPDGTKRLYSTSSLTNNGTVRYVSLTGVEDAAGNRVSIGVRGYQHVDTVTDPLGQVTQFFYELTDPGEPNPGDPFSTYNQFYGDQITRIVDPFGRSAQFQYTKVLSSIQGFCDAGMCPFYYYAYDLTNITDVAGLSSQFSNTNDYIGSLTTPYGTTSFQWNSPGGRSVGLEITDPNGDKERIEYSEDNNVNVPFADVLSTVPLGMATGNRFLYSRNTYHWDKNAYARGFATNDYSNARIYHFTHDINLGAVSPILESTKMPLENRVWFNYPGQTLPIAPGTDDRPSKIGRVLDDGTTQLQQFERNSLGNVTRSIDPVGRTLSFIYATNDVDLLEVRQSRAANNELLVQATYDSRHLPLSITDAAGQTTRFSYNGRGQLLSVTNANNESVSFSYDSNGYLLAADGPLPGLQDQSTFIYDAAGRLRTATDPDGYALNFDYDPLDRLIKTTFPDGTFQQITYDRLRPGVVRDRLGRETRYTYNALRQISAIQDALGRVTRFDWCKCGDLKSLIDPLGRSTTWRHDLQGRVSAKEYADGSRVSFDYETTTSRLRQIRDEQNQFTQFSYNPDNSLHVKRYLNAVVSTPSVRFTYDPDYSRVLTMQDGNGMTAFTYHPVPAAGAGRLASIDGPWANDTITLAYDPLGRLVSPAINGVAVRRTFDSAGRLTQLTNVLGVFDLTWEAGSERLSGVHYPNGQATEYSYHPNSRDQLLQRVTHRLPNNSVLSEFTYLYNAIAQVTNETHFQGSSLKTWLPAYDAGERLLGLTELQSGAPSQTLNYAYDKDDNRTTEQGIGAARNYFYNALNQVTAISDSSLPVTSYQWDAEHRLVAISNGTHRTELSYDGLNRRTGIVEKENDAVVSERHYLWEGLQLAEERDATGGATLKRFSSFGVASSAGADLPPGNYFFTRDNLASVREMCDQAGNVRGRFEFSPYGVRQRLSGDLEPGFGFTGHPLHLPSSLHLAPFRAYDARLARWISRDPSGESQGANLYTYVLADPINFLDPLGQGGTAADPLMQNTAGFKDAKAGVNAYESGKTLVKTVDTITDKGLQAAAQGKFEEMGKDAMEKIVPRTINQYKDGVNDMAKATDEGSTTLEKGIEGTYGATFANLRGAPCRPAPAPPVKVDPPKPGIIDTLIDTVKGWTTPSKPDQVPRNGAIPRTPQFSTAERAAAAR